MNVVVFLAAQSCCWPSLKAAGQVMLSDIELVLACQTAGCLVAHFPLLLTDVMHSAQATLWDGKPADLQVVFLELACFHGREPLKGAADLADKCMVKWDCAFKHQESRSYFRHQLASCVIAKYRRGTCHFVSFHQSKV